MTGRYRPSTNAHEIASYVRYGGQVKWQCWCGNSGVDASGRVYDPDWDYCQKRQRNGGTEKVNRR